MPIPRLARSLALVMSLSVMPMLALLHSSRLAWAQDAPEASFEEQARAFEASLDFRSGDVELSGGLATLALGDAYRFLGGTDAERVLSDAWGNPPSEPPLGMIFPAAFGPFDDATWAVVVRYEEDGYVSDDDATSIDFAELLDTMKSEALASNDALTEAGYETIEVVGWAEPPHYDGTSNKLYWAKELAFGQSPDHTLNYSIRVLGRRGVLVLNAIGDMDQLDDVRTGMQDVLRGVEFAAGNRYSEFDPSIDEVAAYGIGALIAGKVAAKAGLLAKLGVMLLAAKKFLWIGLIAVFALLRKLFSRGATREPTHTGS